MQITRLISYIKNSGPLQFYAPNYGFNRLNSQIRTCMVTHSKYCQRIKMGKELRWVSS